ncbi:hypothetical protein K8R04_04125 [Candidatus Uhrbacteria bacterium]|nr:hypothetical protein [Candidatus Uhrbacteria bacterium]
MTSTNFLIQWDNINSGGLDNASSTNFSSRDTLGDNASGTSTSANFQLSAGYRAPEGANTLTYQVRSRSASVSSAYTAFSNGANTVTVSSAVGFYVGDLISVIENNDFSQFAAIGRITDIAGLVITVDDFDGDGGSMSAVPAGGDDTVYLLNSNSINFGTIDAGTPYTSVVGTSVLTNVASGYSLYILADQELQNASAQIITAVSDGTVSLGAEEYGAETTGSTAFSAGTDLAVTTTQRVVQTSGASTGSISDKIGMIYKLSVLSSTNPGAYSQNVYYTLTANY